MNAWARSFAALRMTGTLPRYERLPKLQIATILAGWLLLIVAPAGAGERAEETPDALKNVGVTERLEAQVPLDLVFADSDGGQRTLGTLFDGTRPVLLTMNYSNCPRLCSLQLNGLVQGMEQLEWNMGDQFRVITVSIDPNESPERAAATKHRYMDGYGRYGPADGWHFLTGREENIRKLADAIGFAYTYVEETRQYAHAAVTMVCTPGGRVSRYLYGIEYKPQTLRLALVEAGEGKVGSTTDRILLLCATYDAASGSYAAAANKLMAIGGGLTVLVLGSALWVAWRREARKKARCRPHAGGSGRCS
ncbi:MAG: SCO family protein [Thermoguttaceae bacterium]